MCLNQNKKKDISTLKVGLKLVEKFIYLGSSISSTESDISTHLVKAWTAIGRLLVIWRPDHSDKIKRNFFHAAVISILLYGCTIQMLIRHIKKKLDGNCTRMLRGVMNKSSKHYPTKQQLYGHLPLISQTIQVQQTRHAEHCRRSSDELISDVLFWTPSHGQATVGQPARTYQQQLCSWEDLLEVMDNRYE